MKRLINISFKGLLAGLSLTACNQFLDEIPDNRVELNTLDKAAQVLTNGYSIASPAFTDWMTDDVSYTVGTTLRPIHEQLYSWEETENIDPGEQDSPEFFWFSTYEAISHANEVLAVLDELPIVNEEDEERRNALEGEAKLIRAYGHFMLVNMFGEHYSNSSSNLGIPYIREPETDFLATYSRLSVNRVYDLIEDDLLDGLELVNDNFYQNSGKYHFTKNSALAFASRFYLYKFDIIRSLQYSNELLGSDPSAFVRDFTSEDFQSSKSSTTGYPQLYSSPDLPANLLLMRKISLVQRTDFAYGISTNNYNTIFGSSPFPGTTDERENPAFVKGLDLDGDQGIFPVRYQSLFERSSLNSNSGTPYHIGIMFRGEEVLLNRVECHLYRGDLQLAINDLNVLFAKRYSGGNNQATMESLRLFLGAENDTSFSDEDVLLNVLLIERQKEFLMQGLRWFDAKRYGITMVHDLPGGQFIALQFGDPRWVLQIPKSAQEVGGLEPNPR